MDRLAKRKALRRILGVLLLVLVIGYAALLFSVNRAMHRSPEEFGRFMTKMPTAIFLIAPFETMWTRARAGHLRIGDTAPEFTLATLDKSAHVSLASIRNDKPVVLVFGSYT
ncbi:MAG TPA: hypothetical protein VNX88_17685 [Terriglobales bacterium]|jgi:hypothetical protein|nr:hypothetical protein [Terriglobales bacterium]